MGFVGFVRNPKRFARKQDQVPVGIRATSVTPTRLDKDQSSGCAQKRRLLWSLIRLSPASSFMLTVSPQPEQHAGAPAHGFLLTERGASE